MQVAPTLQEDAVRCAAVRDLGHLDSTDEARFDSITQLACTLFEVPIAAVSLVDSKRQYFKSRQGLEVRETPRDVSFCGHTISRDETLVVEDASEDPRFADNPLVIGEPRIRFYAGHPVRSPDGHRVGTICLIDHRARNFSDADRQRLAALAPMVERELAVPPPAVEPRRVSGAGRIARFFGGRVGALLSALMIGVSLVLFGAGYNQELDAAYRAEAEREVLRELTVLRGQMEASLNAMLHLVHGLDGFVRASASIDEPLFLAFAGQLGRETRGVRSLQLAPGGVVRYVWPLEGNEAAIGHDLLADPGRRAAAEQAIKQRALWLAGPLQLIQGGVALIGRYPIFVPTAEGERFWGFATILIDVDTFFSDVGVDTLTTRMQLAMRGRDSRGSEGEVFFGDAEVFRSSPVSAALTLPAGSWELAALPIGGWPAERPGADVSRLMLVIAAMLCGGLLYFLLRLPSNLRRSILRSTHALEAGERRFRDAIEALPNGFAIFDQHDELAVCNDRYRQWYQLSDPRPRQGHRYEDLLRAGLRTGQYRLPSAMQAEPEAWLQDVLDRHASGEARYQQQLGDGRWVLVLERRMRDGGTACFHIDISDQKAGEDELVVAREKAESSLRAKSAFLATVSHELRTPLNGLLGLLGVLREQLKLEGRPAEYLQTAHKSAQQLLTILNEILDISKMEAGRLELEAVPFRLPRMLEATLALIQHHAREKGLAIDLSCSGDVEMPVLGDEGRLRQVVLNVLSNAIKFTDAGSINVQLDARQDDDGDIAFEIQVRDTGIGFSETDAQRLFEPFAQVDQKADRRHSGTGLGLAICRRLIEQMGGSIEASGTPGAGACFRIHLKLPLSEQTSPPEIDSAATAAVPAEFGWPVVRVLLAEDSPTNQMVVEAMLEGSGYRVDLAANGAEAVAACRRLAYDLILMDVYMPEMDGVAATRAIREELGLRNVPIIALTANAMEGDEERFREAGMDDYLPKPVERERLLKLLFKWALQPAKDRAHPGFLARRTAPISTEFKEETYEL